ncbi:hypothetical protein [Thioalkalivibrio sp. ALE31]|uniref:hypothetical protein n=1 Tax=Thioalkalivibrio sp. ALE31 TaxID=1158182 RepID=UPI00047819A1|nr:hypothetical protein [Thioalkalivibrio sp. ALE31]
MNAEPATGLAKSLFKDDTQRRLAAGRGSWAALTREELHVALVDAEERWSPALRGVERPWLCWNVDADWCLVQQRMAAHLGWTPVVGFDPRVGPPPVIKGGVLIDFNEKLQLPSMSMMFPLELAFLFVDDRLAFWHSDLIVRMPLLTKMATRFDQLKPGQTAAVDLRTRWYRRWAGFRGRYWELLGCTTRQASYDQYQKGCGWWRRPAHHPNCPSEEERAARARYMMDHGVGILIWHERHRGDVVPIKAKPLDEGHCTRIGNPRYVAQSPNDVRRDLSKDLSFNYDLQEVCRGLDVTDFLKDFRQPRA